MVDLLSAELELAKNAYDNGDTSTALLDALWFVCNEFEKTAKDIDISWFQNGVSEIILKTTNAEEKKWINGYMVACLIGFGCSKNQAELALSEWLGKGYSKDTLKKAHDHISKNDYCREEPSTGLDYKTCSYISLISFEVDKKFPQRYKKAYSAFLKAGVNYFEGDYIFCKNEKTKSTFLKSAGLDNLEQAKEKIA